MRRAATGIPLTHVVVACAILASAGPRSAAAESNAPATKPPAQAFQGFTKNDWPVQITLRPLTLATHMLQIGGDTLVIGLSKGAPGEPVALAPNIEFGVTRWLTVGVQHRLGLCVVDRGCTSAYNDVAFAAVLAIVHRGPLALALTSRVSVPRLSTPAQVGIDTGSIARIGSTRFALRAEPRAYWALAGQDDEFDAAGVLTSTGQKSQLVVPLALQWQVTPQVAVSATGGVNSEFGDFGNYEVSAGFASVVAFNHRIDLGAEFRFTSLAGRNDVGRGDKRELLLRWTLRR